MTPAQILLCLIGIKQNSEPAPKVAGPEALLAMFPVGDPSLEIVRNG